MEDQEEKISSGQSLLDEGIVGTEDEEEPYVHSDISTPPPEQCNNDPDEPLDLQMNTNTTEIQKEDIVITTPPRYTHENYVPDICHGKSFSTWMFKEKDAEVVLGIPDLPNGNTFYKIYTS